MPSSDLYRGVEATGEFASYMAADTWYPTWSRRGLLSPWTDGRVGDWTCASRGGMAATGHARIDGDDPRRLTITPLGTRFASPRPYLGRYPSGGYAHAGVWYAGTYCLNESGNGRNYDIMGPFVGFDSSSDGGHTWKQTPHTPRQPLFGEDPAVMPVRIGAPHAVDFGCELEHSPDGWAYFTAHGSTSDTDHASWITGDAVYLLRVRPDSPNSTRSWEYYAGAARGDPWSDDLDDLRPLIDWPGSLGCVTVTWFPAINRYLMFITDGKDTVSAMDSYLLEAPRLTGPWSMAAAMPLFGPQAYFLNAPSRFLSPTSPHFWLCYSANFTSSELAADAGLPAVALQPDPPGSKYALCLLELRLLVK